MTKSGVKNTLKSGDSSPVRRADYSDQRADQSSYVMISSPLSALRDVLRSTQSAKVALTEH